jgi:hypothetical protein
MKILISSDSPFAHYYERLGLANAFNYAGHQAVMWDLKGKSEFDAFNEFEPDIFIGQTYNITRALIKCIKARPNLKVIMKAGENSLFSDNLDIVKYPVLIADEREKSLVKQLRDETGRPDFLFVHYHPDYVDQTHGRWTEELGIPVHGIMNAADIFHYTNGTYREEFACQVGFVGGYWGYKAKNLDKYILPLCQPASNIHVRIFGNQPWPVPQYCGFVDTKHVRDIFSSALICPNISEPHSLKYHYDIIERPFKLLSNRSFVISDKVQGLQKLIPNGIVYADNPEDFQEKIRYYIKNPDQRYSIAENGHKEVIKNHTYFSRASLIFRYLSLHGLADKILEDGMKAVSELGV